MDLEDVSSFTLSDERREALLATQRECTFIWASRDGQPVGVTMSYLWQDGHFLLASTAPRKRTLAVRRDPRVSIVITSVGTDMGPSKSLTYLGTCEVLHDEPSKLSFYKALTDQLFGDNEVPKAGFIKTMNSPNRVILRVTPVRIVNSYDGDALRAALAASQA